MIDDLIKLRREFHQNPEPGFQEHWTSRRIAEVLKSWGFPVTEGIAGTGLSALLKVDGGEKTIMIRADMDALPLNEENQVEYRSRRDGFMHACGHDGHMAIVLGTARVLKERKNELKGNVKFVFQPAEEIEGGAMRMIEEGILKEPEVNAAIGFHIWNNLPLGQAAVTTGAAMAAVDHFKISIKGKGGHGALPHLSIDPVVTASQVINSIQTVVSRNINPMKSAVISVGSIHSGTVFNIIPEKVDFEGTVRTFDRSLSILIERRMKEIVSGICSSAGCGFDFEYRRTSPVLVNDKGITETLRKVVIDLLGRKNVHDDIRSMGGEDMAYYLEKVPGCYFFLGASNKKKGFVHLHHTSRFDFDEDVLSTGVEILSMAAVKILDELR